MIGGVTGEMWAKSRHELIRWDFHQTSYQHYVMLINLDRKGRRGESFTSELLTY